MPYTHARGPFVYTSTAQGKTGTPDPRHPNTASRAIQMVVLATDNHTHFSSLKKKKRY